MEPLSSHCNAGPVTGRRLGTPLLSIVSDKPPLSRTHVHQNTCMLYQHTSMHTYSGIGARKHALAVHGSAGSARNNLMPRKAYSVCVCVYVSRGTPRQRTETRRGTKRNERNRKYAQTQSACCAWTGEACAHGRARIPVPTRDEWCGVCSPAYHPCCPTRPAARSCTGIPPAPSPGWCRRPPSRCRASWQSRRNVVRAGAGWFAGQREHTRSSIAHLQGLEPARAPPSSAPKPMSFASRRWENCTGEHRKACQRGTGST